MRTPGRAREAVPTHRSRHLRSLRAGRLRQVSRPLLRPSPPLRVLAQNPTRHADLQGVRIASRCPLPAAPFPATTPVGASSSVPRAAPAPFEAARHQVAPRTSLRFGAVLGLRGCRRAWCRTCRLDISLRPYDASVSRRALHRPRHSGCAPRPPSRDARRPRLRGRRATRAAALPHRRAGFGTLRVPGGVALRATQPRARRAAPARLVPPAGFLPCTPLPGIPPPALNTAGETPSWGAPVRRLFRVPAALRVAGDHCAA
jgi:hypothetical protein